MNNFRRLLESIVIDVFVKSTDVKKAASWLTKNKYEFTTFEASPKETQFEIVSKGINTKSDLIGGLSNANIRFNIES